VTQLPAPLGQPGHLLIANERSLVSAGTEKMVIELAKKSLLGKARERPDQVRRVVEKIRNEGFFDTLRQVREKLDEPMTMGYSSTGVVLACGDGVQAYKPGDRVASNGPHAEVVCVPKHLCARVPDSVASDQAAFTVLGAIAMQGVRLSKATLGETVLVIGLGLVGQLTVALLKAAGCRVVATDLDASRCELAVKMGADISRPNLKASDVGQLTGGLGADAVLITAATKSDGPVQLASEAVRQKGRIVLVGVADLHFDRRPMYFKEAEFVVSCSYGPGRYDADYEERGQDYPAAHVRWTEQRNLQAVLELMAAGRLDVSPLISHRFAIEQAEDAYRLIEEGPEAYMGILLEYPGVRCQVSGVREEEVASCQLLVDREEGREGMTNVETPNDEGMTNDEYRNPEIESPPVSQPSTLNPQPSSPLTTRQSLLPAIKNRKSKIENPIGVGVLGAGNFAKMVLIPKIAGNSRFNPIGICSAKGVSATHVGRKHGFEFATTDERELLEDSRIDALFSITRHDQHARHVIRATEAGKHVFVEKPLCLTVEELKEIEDAIGFGKVSGVDEEVASCQLLVDSEEGGKVMTNVETPNDKGMTNVECRNPKTAGDSHLAARISQLPSGNWQLATGKSILMVGFNRRFSPAAVFVRDFFADTGAKKGSGTDCRNGPTDASHNRFLPLFSPLTVSIRFNAGAIPGDHWTQNSEEGGGRIVGEACHGIDLATYLVGAPPVRVFAESIGNGSAGITDDQCFITLRHANGSVSNIAYLAGGDKAFPKERIEIIGGGRIAVIDDFRSVTTCANGKTRRRKFRRRDKGHAAEIKAFADAISESRDWPIPWSELRAVTLASILAVRSLREGLPFEVPRGNDETSKDE